MHAYKKRDKNQRVNVCFSCVKTSSWNPPQLWKMQLRLVSRKIKRSPAKGRRAIRTMREMHSSLNVSRQPLRKRDKSRLCCSLFSPGGFLDGAGRCCQHRRRCSGIKYPIESLIRLQTRSILGHLFAPTAMFALGRRDLIGEPIFFHRAPL